MTDDVRVAEIAARAEAATEDVTDLGDIIDDFAGQEGGGYGISDADAEMVESARRDILWLIDRFRESQSEVRRLRSVVEDAEARGNDLESRLDGSHSREIVYLNRALDAERVIADIESRRLVDEPHLDALEAIGNILDTYQAGEDHDQ